MCSTLTNNANSSGRLTFVASPFTFVAAQLWGLRTATSTPYMLWSLRAEWHTCLSGFCICVYGSGQNSIVGLLHQQLHSTAYAQPCHYRAMGGQWGYCFRCTHAYPWTPPLWYVQAIFYWSVLLDSGHSAPTVWVNTFTHSSLFQWMGGGNKNSFWSWFVILAQQTHIVPVTTFCICHFLVYSFYCSPSRWGFLCF